MTEPQLSYRGDFADWDCPKCYRRNDLTIKDGTNLFYYCSYCGWKFVLKPHICNCRFCTQKDEPT